MNQDDMLVLNGLADTIRKKGAITMSELWKTSNLTVWQFEKYKKYLPQLFEDIIYDRKHQKYISRNNVSNFVEENLK